MKLVIDTNIVISALIRDSTTRRLIMYPGLDLISPEYLHMELQKYDTELIELTGLDPRIYNIVKNEILSKITTVPYSEYGHNFEDALEIMKEIDEDDSSFIAVALSLAVDGIWSNDKGLQKQQMVKVWTTKDLIDIIEGK